MKKRFGTFRNVLVNLLFLGVVAFFLYSAFRVFKVVLLNSPVEAVYEVVNKAWWGNFVALAVVIVANFLYQAETSRKIDVLLRSGLCGVGTFLFFGVFEVFWGFAIGKVWMPVMMFIVMVYMCIIIAVAVAYFSRTIREKETADEQSNKPTGEETCV